MKKLVILLLIVFAIGCAKKHVKQEPVRYKEAAQKTEDLFAKSEKEVVTTKLAEDSTVTEEKITEVDISDEAGAKERKDVVLQDVLFDYDKYDVRADALPALDKAASFLKSNPKTKVIIEGHCDERGTNEYNLALGEKRAKSAGDYLASVGVSSSRITIVTYGEEKPVCTVQDESCWHLNRRAHFVVTE